MRKLRIIGLGLLLSVFCWHGLWSQPLYGDFATGIIQNYALPLNLLEKPILLKLPMSNMTPLLNYSAILTQYEGNLNQPLDNQENSNSLTTELTNLLNNQMQDLQNLETQWQALEAQSKTLSNANKELMSLLASSKETIAQLRWNLECALERVTDAEEGALVVLDENNELYQQAKLAMANISILQEQLVIAKRGAVIGFTFGGVGFGVGAPLITMGIMNDNSTMMWTGAGVVLGSGAIWALGHYLLNWW